MATDVILPALGMSQDTGKIVQWLKSEGQRVAKGEPLAEIETDKATVELEAPAEGVLARVSAAAGDDVPVGQVIALILSAHEALPEDRGQSKEPHGSPPSSAVNANEPEPPVSSPEIVSRSVSTASILAARVAADHNVDLSQVKASGKRIQSADVLAYIAAHGVVPDGLVNGAPTATIPRLMRASPKARRLANEHGKDLATIKGSGPGGAVLTADVLAADGVDEERRQPGVVNAVSTVDQVNRASTLALANGARDEGLSTIGRIMAERTTQSWTGTPHFYLTREVNASRLIHWREHTVGARSIVSALTTSPSAVKITYTDLLVKIVAAALRIHPRLNASWGSNKIILHPEIHVGLAVAIEDGLVVPVIHQADTLGLSDIAQQRVELVAKAQAGKLRPQDISGGTFTISNLGMYNIDAFNAIINQPQVAILAVGRIAERVVPVQGQPAVQPMLVLTLSCDHRAVDGARGARFLDSVANFIEEPLGLLT